MSKTSVNHRLQQAKSLAKKGDHDAAGAIYAAVLRQFPNNKRAQDGLAALGRAKTNQDPPKARVSALIALYQAGHFKEAATQARHLAQSFPTSFVVWNLCGAACAQSHQKPQAIEAYQRAATLNPTDAGVQFSIGVMQQDLGNPSQALASYARAIALKPDHADAHNNMGNIFAAKGALLDAIGSYERAVALAPTHAGARSNLGAALEKSGQLNAAREAFEKVLKQMPQSVDAALNLGRVQLALAVPAQAAKAYRHIIALDPNNAAAHSGLGIALQHLDNPHEAIRAYRRALRLNPNYAEGHMNLGNLLSDLGRYPQAVAGYRAALALDPSYRDAAENAVKLPSGFLDQDLMARIGRFAPAGDQGQGASQAFQIEYLRHQGQLDTAFVGICALNVQAAAENAGQITADQQARDAYLQRLADWTPIVHQSPPERLRKLFVLGPSRSGKTLLERVLGTSKAVIELFESVNGSPDSIAALHNKDESQLRAQGCMLATGTNPHLIEAIADIADRVPEAVFVVMARAQNDLGADIFAKHYKSGNLFSYDKDAITRYLIWYDEMARLIQAKMPDRVMRVNFADFLQNTPDIGAQIEAFIGLDLAIDASQIDMSAIAAQAVYADHYKKL